MKPETIFNIIITIIVVNFLLERWMDWLNDKNSSETLPEELKGIYDEEKYAKQRAYEKVKGRFYTVSSTFSFVLILAMLFFKEETTTLVGVGHTNERPGYRRSMGSTNLIQHPNNKKQNYFILPNE